MAPPNFYVPSLIEVPKSNPRKAYRRVKLIGKGSTSLCYEVQDQQSGEYYAVKVVHKMSCSPTVLARIFKEIQVHSELRHENIVTLYNTFEADSNLYLIMELCKFGSLMELIKRRTKLTVPEAKFISQQIGQGVDYLHSKGIMHRDIKPDNILIDANIQVKIADFGLAVVLSREGERRWSLCGTPNFMAPETVNRVGQSFSADMWSVGCVIYALLAGKPPFDTASYNSTVDKIRNLDFTLKNIDAEASHLITQLLQANPSLRLNSKELLKSEFLNSGFIPTELPQTIFVVEPRFEVVLNRKNAASEPVLPRSNVASREKVTESALEHLKMIEEKLSRLLQVPNLVKPNVTFSEVSCDPTAQARMWICKWTDYTVKWGFGYKLSDNSFGVLFNDKSILILFANEHTLQYIDKEGKESFCELQNLPENLQTRVHLLKNFKTYMATNLENAGGRTVTNQGDSMTRLPYLSQWCRAENNIIMLLTNGILQINNTLDHKKLIVCPVMEAVTYIGTENLPQTYLMTTIESQGCTQDIVELMQRGLDLVKTLGKKIAAVTSPPLP